VAARGEYTIATGNDADADRHGIVTADGLMNPNHFLAVAIGYLFANRPAGPRTPGGQDRGQLVDDRPGGRGPGPPAGRDPGRVQVVRARLLDGSIGFGGEESAGASFLRRDGGTWTTDKDGIILALLASEITARTGRTPSEHYRELTSRFGEPAYARTDVATTAEDKARLGKLSADDVTATELAGDPITQRLTSAPGNGAALGGLKVVTEGGWFAARPSGTEDVYKVYAESVRGPEHLARIQEEAQAVVSSALG
jgi:phosphoglucomutase